MMHSDPSAAGALRLRLSCINYIAHPIICFDFVCPLVIVLDKAAACGCQLAHDLDGVVCDSFEKWMYATLAPKSNPQ